MQEPGGIQAKALEEFAPPDRPMPERIENLEDALVQFKSIYEELGETRVES